MRSVSRQIPILLIRSGFSLLQGTGRMQHAFPLALFLDIRSFFVFLCSGTIVKIGPPSLRNIVNSLSSPCRTRA